MNRYATYEAFALGTVLGAVVSSLAPDLPTTLDYAQNRPDLHAPLVLCWILLFGFVGFVLYEARRA